MPTARHSPRLLWLQRNPTVEKCRIECPAPPKKEMS